MSTYLIILIVYLAIMIGVGMWGSKNTKNTEDFLIASGKMGLLLVVASLFGNMISGFTIVGSLGMNYVSSWADLAFLTGPAAAGYIILGVAFAPRIRKVLANTGKFTIPDMFKLRYGKTAALLAAIMLLLVFLAFAGGQIEAIHTVLVDTLHISPTFALIAITACVIFYSFFGGMWSLAYTMVIQAVVIWIGMIVCMVVSLKAGGDWGTMVAAMPAGHFSPWSYTTVAGGIAFGASLFLADFPAQDMWQRASAAKDAKTARNAFIIFAFLALGLGVINFFIGVAGRYLFPNLANSESLFSTIVTTLMHPMVGSIVLAALVSAILSTAAACFLVIAMLITNDIYKPYIAPNKEDKHYLNVNRIVLVLAGVLSLIFVILVPSVIGLLYMACNIMVSALFLPVIGLFFWKRVNAMGGLLGVLCGGAADLIWVLAGNPGGIADFYIGILASLVGLLLGTYLGKAPSKEQTEGFFDEIAASGAVPLAEQTDVFFDEKEVQGAPPLVEQTNPIIDENEVQEVIQ